MKSMRSYNDSTIFTIPATITHVNIFQIAPVN